MIRLKYLSIMIWFFSAEIASACATCYGDPNSSAGRGMDMAILTLLGIITPILFAIGVGIISIGLKSKKMNKTK